MENRELKIGNWVEQPNTGPQQVTAILNDIQIKTTSGHVDKYCRRIPLSEKWLDMFGCTTHYTGTQKEYETPNPEIIIKVFVYTKETLFFVNYRGTDIKRIEFVHQLQNLWFELTEEELIIEKII